MKQLTIILNILGIFLLSSCKTPEVLLHKQKPALYSYIFANINDEKIIAEKQSNVFVTPASLNKVITALLAEKTLGFDYKYETKLYAAENNNLLEYVVIEFVGDPTLSSADLLKLLEPLQNQTVTGKIILDASKFQTPEYSDYWMLCDIGSSYAAPLSSTIIDNNRINIVATPNDENHPAHIAIDTKYPYKNDTITNHDPSLIIASWQDDIIHITGNINALDQEYKRKLAPKNINPFIIQKIENILAQLNIKGKVEITKSQVEPILNLALVNQHLSKPLKDIMQSAMKLSKNLEFDSIYLTIANNNSDQIIKTWFQACAEISELLQKHLNLSKDDIIMIDGSGISRYNQIKPKSLLSILHKNYTNNNFLQLLASAGEDNTTLTNRDLISIIAKTGHMRSINSLCGYKLGTKPYAFVVVANGFSGDQNDMNNAIDQFINDMLK